MSKSEIKYPLYIWNPKHLLGFKDQVLAIDVHFVLSIIGNGMLYYLKCDVGKYINVLDTYKFNAKPQIEIDRRSCM